LLPLYGNPPVVIFNLSITDRLPVLNFIFNVFRNASCVAMINRMMSARRCPTKRVLPAEKSTRLIVIIQFHDLSCSVNVHITTSLPRTQDRVYTLPMLYFTDSLDIVLYTYYRNDTRLLKECDSFLDCYGHSDQSLRVRMLMHDRPASHLYPLAS